MTNEIPYGGARGGGKTRSELYDLLGFDIFDEIDEKTESDREEGEAEMTGFELLKEELKKRGFTKQQVENSKMLPTVLDIIAQSGDRYTNIVLLEKDIRRLEDNITQLYRSIRDLKVQEEKISKEIQSKKDEYKAYIDEFYKVLENCETPDGRDAIKIAQMFINSVNVDSKYDNTAYIIALGAILSKGKVAAIEELKKINKKLPWEEDWDIL